jgi:hypothetical protein
MDGLDDGQVGILKDTDGTLHLLNESVHPYNIHPMWREVRLAFKVSPLGYMRIPKRWRLNFGQP